MSNIKMIFAKSQNNIIGDKGKLPWHLPEDLKYFKEQTEGKIVLMGRHTWESIPEQYRPLPNRENVIVSTDPYYAVRKDVEFENVKVINNLNGYLLTHLDKEIWVIGGLAIYNACRYIVNEIHITTILKDFQGDTVAPVIDEYSFRTVSQTAIRHSEKANLDYTISVLQRN